MSEVPLYMHSRHTQCPGLNIYRASRPAFGFEYLQDQRARVSRRPDHARDSWELYRGTSRIRYRHPPRTITGP